MSKEKKKTLASFLLTAFMMMALTVATHAHAFNRRFNPIGMCDYLAGNGISMGTGTLINTSTSSTASVYCSFASDSTNSHTTFTTLNLHVRDTNTTTTGGVCPSCSSVAGSYFQAQACANWYGSEGTTCSSVSTSASLLNTASEYTISFNPNSGWASSIDMPYIVLQFPYHTGGASNYNTFRAVYMSD